MSSGDIALLILEIIGGCAVAVVFAAGLFIWWVKGTYGGDA